MKLIIVTFLFSVLIIYGCSSGKDTAQRRNLMIPQKNELPRNSKYAGAKKNKVNCNNKNTKSKKYY